MKKYLLPVVILAGLGLVAAAFLYKRYNMPPSIDMPAIAVSDLKGHPVTISSYGGEPIFVSFFASWCGPCMKEIPELNYMRSKLGSRRLEILCISDEPLDKLIPLQTRFGDGIIFLHSDVPMHDLGIYTFPTNYIFNAGGEKVYSKTNTDDWETDEMIEKVKRLIR